MISTRIFPSAIDTIGSTPLIALDRLTAGLEGRILAKAEMFNPGLSKKDRAALRIVTDAEKSGRLRPGQTVVELTSGNMGAGLAIVCAVRDYPFVAVMSKGNSPERAHLMRMFGAEVVLIDQAAGYLPGRVSGDDLALVEAAAAQITRERKAFRADQFHNQSNADAHYFETAREIWRQTNGRFDVFCDFVGSGGTLGGCGQYFKEMNEDIRCCVVEPAEAAVFSGSRHSAPHEIQGGGYGMTELPLLKDDVLDLVLAITSNDAKAAVVDLARKEGLFAGISSGANLAAALALLKGPCRGQVIVTILADSGMKYLSSLFN